MDFTREPLVQTVITPKEGCKIVVRSSKNSGQEEYFVDAVEVVSFGPSIFFRSLERPKAFLVPASDYEILEVREARMVLKNVGVDRAIKIGGGRDAAVRGGREITHEKHEPPVEVAKNSEQEEEDSKTEGKTDTRADKKRDRRRNARRRRGREDTAEKDPEEEGMGNGERIELPKPIEGNAGVENLPLTSILTSLLPPPPTLISESIAKYRENASFKDAFFSREEQVFGSSVSEIIQPPTITLEQPAYGSFEVTEEEEEEIYQQRQKAKEDLEASIDSDGSVQSSLTEEKQPSDQEDETTQPEDEHRLPE